MRRHIKLVVAERGSLNLKSAVLLKGVTCFREQAHLALPRVPAVLRCMC